MKKRYQVYVVDLPQKFELGEGFVAAEFSDLEMALEFARRWVRDTLEELRSTGISDEELRSMWFQFGEDARVPQANYSASINLDFFIQNPATPDERDWKAIKLLAEDFDGPIH